MATEFELEQAKKILESDGIVGVPTETVYGLAGLIDSPNALRSIFELKGRPFYDPLIIHVGDADHLSLLSPVSDGIVQRLISAFWPGPLTLVLPKHSSVDPLITSGLDTVGVRMPNHPVALDLLRRLRAPFAAPSANRFKRTSPTTEEHVRTEFPDSGLFVVDGGPCAVGIESTVLQITDPDRAQILRPGVITAEQIRSVLAGSGVEVSIGESSASPGHMAEHYMPERPLVILSQRQPTLSDELRRHICNALGVEGNSEEIILDESPLISARELYGRLRRGASRADFLIVYRQDSHTGELWAAVWNRLRKAATLDLSGSE